MPLVVEVPREEILERGTNNDPEEREYGSGHCELAL